MARGFLGGVLLGGVVSVGVAGLTSVLAPPPVQPEISDAAPGATQEPLGEGARDEDASVADATLEPAPAIPQAPQPAPDTLTTLDEDATQTAALPETGTVGGMEAPAAAPESGGVVIEADEPVLPNPQALAPMAPQDADDLSISTEPAQPPAPDTEESAFDSAAVAVPETPEAPELVEDMDEDVGLAPGTAEDDAPDASQSDQPMVQPDGEGVTIFTNDEDPQASAPAEAEPAVEPEVTADTGETPNAEGRPQIGTPATTLDQRSYSVPIIRPGEDDSAAPQEATTEEARLTANAAEFEPEGDKPLMSIVLIDDGSQLTSGAQGIAALRSFPYPLSFAVDADLPDAAERMALYRAEGFEVLAMVDLPEGAQPSDAETTFNALLPAMDQAVAVLEGPEGGFQSGREVSDQVTAILADEGLGLVTQDAGLNTMPKLARKAGVPADPIFRDFDSNGQSATVIRRFLDQAAFKAGQEGAVIMLGRLRPDTISALLLWGLQDRASTVSLAPVSAVLTRD